MGQIKENTPTVCAGGLILASNARRYMDIPPPDSGDLSEGVGLEYHPLVGAEVLFWRAMPAATWIYPTTPGI